MSAPTYNGLYINLDRSTDRRAAIEKRLAVLGLAQRYKRVRATDGAALDRTSRLSPAVVATFASHLAAIEEAAGSEVPTHIIEDDVLLSGSFVAAAQSLLQRGALDRFDIVFTEMMLPPNLEGLKKLKVHLDAAKRARGPAELVLQLQLLDLARLSFSGATSYFLAPRGAGKIAAILKREWESGPTLQVDNFIRREIQSRRISGACLFPFVTSFDPHSLLNSTIDPGPANESAVVLGLLRYAFYIDADFAGAARAMLDEIIQRMARERADPQREFLADVFSVVITDRFRLV